SAVRMSTLLGAAAAAGITPPRDKAAQSSAVPNERTLTLIVGLPIGHRPEGARPSMRRHLLLDTGARRTTGRGTETNRLNETSRSPHLTARGSLRHCRRYSDTVKL